MRSTGLIRSGLAAALLLLAACTDLSAVRDFSRLAAGTADYRGIVQRYADYGERRVRYGLPRIDVGERQAQAAGLLAMQDAITTYMGALGALADDRVVTVSANPLVDAAVKAGAVDTAASSTVTALGDLILRAATGRYRQGQIGEVIAAANAPVQDLAARLIRFAGSTADEDREEATALRFFYGGLDRRSNDPAGKRALTEWRDLRLQQITARAPSRDAYIAGMRKIAEGHQLLTDNRGRLSVDETVRQVRAVNDQLQRIGRELQQFAGF